VNLSADEVALPPGGGMVGAITIGGLLHTVQAVDSEFFVDENNLGECDYVLQDIRLLEAMTPERKRQVLWHEAFEGINGVYLLELGHIQLSVLAVETLRILDDNPALREYLWGKK